MWGGFKSTAVCRKEPGSTHRSLSSVVPSHGAAELQRRVQAAVPSRSRVCVLCVCVFCVLLFLMPSVFIPVCCRLQCALLREKGCDRSVWHRLMFPPAFSARSRERSALSWNISLSYVSLKNQTILFSWEFLLRKRCKSSVCFCSSLISPIQQLWSLPTIFWGFVQYLSVKMKWNDN